MGEDECFNCAEPASETYTLVLAPGRILEDKVLCDTCVSDFRDVEWIEVHEAPVLKRGNNEDQEDEDQ